MDNEERLILTLSSPEFLEFKLKLILMDFVNEDSINNMPFRMCLSTDNMYRVFIPSIYEPTSFRYIGRQDFSGRPTPMINVSTTDPCCFEKLLKFIIEDLPNEL